MASTAAPPHSGEASIRALLWDVDGTLAETELDGHRRAFNLAFAQEGLPWRWDVETYLGLLRISGGRERMRAYGRDCAVALSEAQLERLQRCKQFHYEQLIRGGAVGLRPGVRRLVREARAAGLTQAIVTTSGRASVRALLQAAGADLAESFAFWVCGEDVARKKPDPEGYRQAVARLDLPARQVLAIEDSRNGLEAALGAGLSCLVTLSDSSRWEAEGTGSESFAAALAVLDGLDQPQHPSLQRMGTARAPAPVSLAWLQSLSAGT